MMPDERLLAEIARFSSLFAGPGGRLELRAPHVPKYATCFGLYNDWTILARDALQLEADGAPGIYVGANLFRHALFEHATPNTLSRNTGWTVADSDIVERRWLPVDLDPVRQGGNQKDSATADEHNEALLAAYAVRDWLIARDVPKRSLLIMDSGNGAYVLVRLPVLPNSDHSRDLLKDVLGAIAFHCETPRIRIDTSVYNASRIIKLPGTLARKGPGTPERPHRRARLLEMPPPP
jgi:hypothetical protein